MIIYGVDINGVAHPILVDTLGRVFITGTVTVADYTPPLTDDNGGLIVGGFDRLGNAPSLLLNTDGAPLIAGLASDDTDPIVAVDSNGGIILSGGNGMAGFLMMTKHSTVLSPTDALVYYVGNALAAPVVTSQRARVRILQNCTLVKSVLEINTAGTLGTTENSTFAVRVNDAADNNIFTTVQFAAIQQAYISATLAIAFSAGDFFEWKWTCPTWVTNPTNVSIISYNWFNLV